MLQYLKIYVIILENKDGKGIYHMKKIISLVLSLCIMSSMLSMLTIGVEGANTVSAATIVSNAKSLVDQYPYVWGGESPEEGGFDCTGLVWYVYNKMSGVNITLSQAGRSKSALASAGTKITGISNFLPGDIVQFDYAHVAIYIGDNTIIEASKPGTRIRYRTINSYSQVSYAIRLSSVTQGNGSYTPTPTPAPTPTPVPSTPATISISQSTVNLNYETKPSETLTVSVSGNLPKEYHLNLNCDSNLNISWGQWSNKSVSLTVSATKNAITNNTATITLKDTAGNTYATKTFNIYVTIPQEPSGLRLSCTSLGIDHVNNPNATVTVYISGSFPDGGNLNVEAGPAVTTEWGNYEGKKANLYITANWRLGKNDETVTVSLVDSNKNILAKQSIHVFTSSKKYYVEFDANGGVNPPDTLIHYEGSESLIDYIRPIRDGYVFKGWAKSKNAYEADYNCGDFYIENRDVVLYAVWEQIENEDDLYSADTDIDNDYLINQKCGDNAYWDFDDGVLTISGYGKMYDFMNALEIPWADIQCDVRKIVIEEGITYIGDNSFAWHKAYYEDGMNLEEIYIPSTVEALGNCTFAYIDEVDTVYYNAKDCDFTGTSLYYAYNYFPRGKTLVIGEEVERIGANVFYRGEFDEVECVGDWNEISVDMTGNEVLEQLTNENTEDIKVIVDGRKIIFDQPPIIENGRTLAPMRAVLEAMNIEVIWNPEEQLVITSRGDDMYVIFEIGSNIVDVCDYYDYSEQVEIDVPAKIVNGRTLIPLRAIAEIYGCTVNWNGNTRTVLIQS